MVMRFLVLVALAVMVVGCAAGRGSWQKAGAVEGELARTSFRCKQQATSLTRDSMPNVKQDFFVYQDFYNNCMMDGGWEFKREAKTE
ncbi:MAG: hypothetical protein QM523_07665 [Candidatus Pacebacteria bacterium]|nr:hypothetical protein [Candidatus Paceibacterota bacterium]